jgi:hypothetical protein
VRFTEKKMIDRHHDLFGIQAEPDSRLFERINGCTVDIRLTGFSQAAIAGCDSESAQ